MQLWGGGCTGGVVVTQGRVLDKLRDRNPAALCRHLGPRWTAAHNKNRKDDVSHAIQPVGGTVVYSMLLHFRHLPGPAAASRLRLSGLLVRLIQAGLFPWRVLDGRALKLHTELA